MAALTDEIRNPGSEMSDTVRVTISPHFATEVLPAMLEGLLSEVADLEFIPHAQDVERRHHRGAHHPVG